MDPGMTEPSVLYEELEDEIGTLLVGLEPQIHLLTIAVLTRGHVLLEGVPGVAKTSLANVFARATGLEYKRMQMTPDILPADITGTKIYREQTGEFELQRGPVFSNVVVADEINRATPKAQSALLEAMEESRVSIEGETLALPDPFVVIATQNPLEMKGTFELPEAQRDRFQMKVSVDLPSRANEMDILQRFRERPDLGPEEVSQVVSPTDIRRAKSAVEQVYVDSSIEEYIMDVVAATRDHPDTEHGASPRGSIALLNTSRARAAILGRDYAIPDDIKTVASPVLVHRLILSTEAEIGDVSPETLVDDILDSVVPPGGHEGSVPDPETTRNE